jgi:hypothetical protein
MYGYVLFFSAKKTWPIISFEKQLEPYLTFERNLPIPTNETRGGAPAR